MFKEIYRKSIELAGHKKSKFFLGFFSKGWGHSPLVPQSFLEPARIIAPIRSGSGEQPGYRRSLAGHIRMAHPATAGQVR